MSIVGYQFDKAKVSAGKDAVLYNSLANGVSYILSGQGDELSLSSSGLSVSIARGMALVCGRLVEVVNPIVVDIPAESSGFVVIKIDLSQENVATGTLGASDYGVVNRQLSVVFTRELVQQDVLNGGLVYMFPLCEVTSTRERVRFTKKTETVSPIRQVSELVSMLVQYKNQQERTSETVVGIKLFSSLKKEIGEIQARLYRTGNRVFFELNYRPSSVTDFYGVAYAELSIPKGYRPKHIARALLGRFGGPDYGDYSRQYFHDGVFMFHPDGTAFVLIPLVNLTTSKRWVAFTEWYTDDEFVG
ncbi:hypothetical protein K6V33_07605 [Streptococcus suis]|nr:hypothetical protein [Streptococcus suis]